MSRVEITGAQMYQQLQELTGAVQAQSGRLDRLCDAQSATGRQVEKLEKTVHHRLTGYADRLRAVEGRLWYLAGGASVAGVVGGAVLTRIINGAWGA